MARSETLPSIAGACDSHVHVFDPTRFPYAAGRAYTPSSATKEELDAFRRRLRLDRIVIVQPSVYGTDNACLLDALRFFGPEVARGVAVIDPGETSDEALADLQAAGVRAVRVNFEAAPFGHPPDKGATIRATAARIVGSGLALQLYIDLATASAVPDMIRSTPVPVILDHYAGYKVAIDPAGAAFQTFLRALRSEHLWVKLSAPYRTGAAKADYEDLRPAAQALMETAPDRLVWASDWPHTGGGAERARRGPSAIEPFRQVDDEADLSRLNAWAPNLEICKNILAENAGRLFEFDPS